MVSGIRETRGLYLTPAADRFFLIPAGHEVPPGDLLVVSVTGTQRRLDPASLAPLEVTRAEARAHLRTGLTADLTAARERLAARGLDLDATLDDLSRHLDTLRQLDQHGAAQAVAEGLRRLTDPIEGDERSLGQRIDALLARLERELGPLVGEDRQAQAAARQEEYRRSAISAIGDALREAGITPLTSTEPDTADDSRRSGA
jgi:hypothetical protein